MLVLKRKEGQWIEITHTSGDVIRFRVYNIRSRFPGQLDIAFEDDARRFTIERPERVLDAQGGRRDGGER
jgi:hypothetical protein